MLEVHVLSRGGVRAPRAFTETALASVVHNLLKDEIPSRARKQLRSAKEVSVLFVDGKEIAKLNRQFRGKNKPTDILSFDAVEFGSLGELVIALDVIRAQAKEHGLSLQDELGYMLLHGVLHLLGYDHEGSKSGARQMFALQDRLFEKLRGRW